MYVGKLWPKFGVRISPFRPCSIHITTHPTQSKLIIRGTTSRQVNEEGIAWFDDLSTNMAGHQLSFLATIKEDDLPFTRLLSPLFQVLPGPFQRLMWMEEPTDCVINEFNTKSPSLVLVDEFQNPIEEYKNPWMWLDMEIYWEKRVSAINPIQKDLQTTLPEATHHELVDIAEWAPAFTGNRQITLTSLRFTKMSGEGRLKIKSIALLRDGQRHDFTFKQELCSRWFFIMDQKQKTKKADTLPAKNTVSCVSSSFLSSTMFMFIMLLIGILMGYAYWSRKMCSSHCPSTFPITQSSIGPQ